MSGLGSGAQNRGGRGDWLVVHAESRDSPVVEVLVVRLRALRSHLVQGEFVMQATEKWFRGDLVTAGNRCG